MSDYRLEAAGPSDEEPEDDNGVLSPAYTQGRSTPAVTGVMTPVYVSGKGYSGVLNPVYVPTGESAGVLSPVYVGPGDDYGALFPEYVPGTEPPTAAYRPTQWFFGHGSPIEALAEVTITFISNDAYLNLDTSDVWVYQLGPGWVMEGTLTGAQGDPGAQGETGEMGPPGMSVGAFPYNWRSSITAVNPTDGCVKGNNTNVTQLTELYISVHDKNGLGLIALNSIDIDDEIFIYESGQLSTWNMYKLTAPVVLQGTPPLWATLPCVYVETGPYPFTPANNGQVLVALPMQGEVGPQGPPGLNPLGAWSPIVNYQPDDLVTRDGSTWLATAPSIGVDPAADPSSNSVASFVAPSPLALGSPTAIATGFTVDRGTSVVAMNLSTAWGGAVPPGVTAGLASAIGVPGVGIQWMGKGAPTTQGRVDLDNTVDLSVGVRYWLVLLGATGVMVDQGIEMIGSHMTWSGEFWYGSSGPDTSFGVYATPVVLYGTTSDNAWQLFVEKGEDGADIVAVPYASWPPASPQPNTLYLRLAP